WSRLTGKFTTERRTEWPDEFIQSCPDSCSNRLPAAATIGCDCQKGIIVFFQTKRICSGPPGKFIIERGIRWPGQFLQPRQGSCSSGLPAAAPTVRDCQKASAVFRWTRRITLNWKSAIERTAHGKTAFLAAGG